MIYYVFYILLVLLGKLYVCRNLHISSRFPNFLEYCFSKLVPNGPLHYSIFYCNTPLLTPNFILFHIFPFVLAIVRIYQFCLFSVSITHSIAPLLFFSSLFYWFSVLVYTISFFYSIWFWIFSILRPSAV